MNQISYNPKEVLSTLLDVEARLEEVNDKNYPKREFLLSEDTDEVLDNFLLYQNVEDSNAGYITTEMALFYLRKELEKTIDVIVVANDLRAYNDYEKSNTKQKPVLKVANRTGLTKQIIIFFIGFLLGLMCLYFYLKLV